MANPHSPLVALHNHGGVGGRLGGQLTGAAFASTSGDRLAGGWSRMALPGNNGAAGAREAAGVCAAEQEQGKPNP